MIPEQRKPCLDCAGRGTVICADDNGSLYARVCHCDAADILQRDFERYAGSDAA